MVWLFGCFCGNKERLPASRSLEKTTPLRDKVSHSQLYKLAASNRSATERERGSDTLSAKRISTDSFQSKESIITQNVAGSETTVAPWIQLERLEEELFELRQRLARETAEAHKLREEMRFLRSSGTPLKESQFYKTNFGHMRRKSRSLTPERFSWEVDKFYSQQASTADQPISEVVSPKGSICGESQAERNHLVGIDVLKSKQVVAECETSSRPLIVQSSFNSTESPRSPLIYSRQVQFENNQIDITSLSDDGDGDEHSGLEKISCIKLLEDKDRESLGAISENVLPPHEVDSESLISETDVDDGSSEDVLESLSSISDTDINDGSSQNVLLSNSTGNTIIAVDKCRNLLGEAERTHEGNNAQIPIDPAYADDEKENLNETMLEVVLPSDSVKKFYDSDPSFSNGGGKTAETGIRKDGNSVLTSIENLPGKRNLLDSFENTPVQENSKGKVSVWSRDAKRSRDVSNHKDSVSKKRAHVRKSSSGQIFISQEIWKGLESLHFSSPDEALDNYQENSNFSLEDPALQKFSSKESGSRENSIEEVERENIDTENDVPNKNLWRISPEERPILGLVAIHWHDQSSMRSDDWWDGKGIPNSTNKYKEDQKVAWHPTPFEVRLEEALSEAAP